MRIESNSNYIQVQNNHNIAFNGVTKKLSHRMFVDGKKDILDLIERTKPNNTNVGSLPPVIFKNIPHEDKVIKGVIDIFCEVADEIRKFKPGINSPKSERMNRRSEKTVEKLKNMFVKMGLIKEDDTFDITFLGEGNYKKAFKIEGIKDPDTNEELCLKVFHLVDKTPEWHKYKTHGNYAELNTSIYWKKTQGMNTQRGKFYFGDLEHGFFVDKFIDKNVERPKKIVDEEKLGVKLTDEVRDDSGHNKLYGYSIDPGGPRVVNRVKNESKLAQKIFNHIQSVPLKYRELEWYKILSLGRMDKRQKEAGLAISIKHLGRRSRIFDECLNFHNPFADMGLAYVLKYLKENNAKKYFKILMQRNNPLTQTVLLNEIPLLARRKIKIDDLDVPKGEINSKKILEYYKMAQQYVCPEIEQHLASYIHLLPEENIIPEAKKLIAKNNYEINDRLLHKIKYVKDEEFNFYKKLEIIELLEKAGQTGYLKEKTQNVKIYIIRNQLED